MHLLRICRRCKLITSPNTALLKALYSYGCCLSTIVTQQPPPTPSPTVSTLIHQTITIFVITSLRCCCLVPYWSIEVRVRARVRVRVMPDVSCSPDPVMLVTLSCMHTKELCSLRSSPRCQTGLGVQVDVGTGVGVRVLG